MMNMDLLESTEMLALDSIAKIADYAFESALYDYQDDKSEENRIALEAAAADRKNANSNWWSKLVTSVKSLIKTLLAKLRGVITRIQNASARSSAEAEKERVKDYIHAFVEIDGATKGYLKSGLSGVNFSNYVAKTAKKMISEKTMKVPESSMFDKRPEPNNSKSTISVSELKGCMDRAVKALNDLNTSFPTTETVMKAAGKEDSDASYVRVAVSSGYNIASKAIREYTATVVEVSRGINDEREEAGKQKAADNIQTAMKVADVATDIADKGRLLYNHANKIDWSSPASIIKNSYSIKDDVYYLDAKNIKNPAVFNKLMRSLSKRKANVNFITKPSFFNKAQKTLFGSGINIVK